MLERKIYRIYDCGCKAWIWKNEEKNDEKYLHSI